MPFFCTSSDQKLSTRAARALEGLRCACFWGAVAVAAWWAVDRAPPLRVLSIAPAAAQRGHLVEITAQVERQLHRRCSVRITRYLHDAHGFRYELERGISLNARDLEVLERRLNPGYARVTALLPVSMSPGPAKLVSSLSYVCNPLHEVWPIRVVMVIPVAVSP